MNDKEKELWRVIDNVIKCCAIELPSGELSITREDVLGKSRAENLVMTRCMVVEQMIHAGFSITTIATVLNRTVPAPRERHHPRLTIREGSKGTHGSQRICGIRCQARLPLHEAASNQGKRADEERRRNEPPLDGRRNPFGDKQRDNLQWRNHRGYSLFG